MEVLAVGASIAGLLSLTAQCVSGAQKLVSLYQHVTSVSSTGDKLLKDINSLLRMLHDVEHLLRRMESEATYESDNLHMASLKLQLEDCNIDLASWLQVAQKQQRGGKGARARFRDFWATVNQDKVKNIRVDIQMRRVEVGVALSAIGRSFDHQLASVTGEINRNVQELAYSTPAYLERLESLSLSISDRVDSLSSSQSGWSSGSAVSSSATGVKNNQEKDPVHGDHGLDDRMDSIYNAMSCQALEDHWEEIFVCSAYIGHYVDDTCTLDDVCILCGRLFPRPPKWQYRRNHVMLSHHGGRCGESHRFFSEEHFTAHLRSDHAVDTLNLSTYNGGNDWDRFDVLSDRGLAHAAIYTGEDVRSTSDLSGSFMSIPWDTLLLNEWTSDRDRINRWILHALGTDDSLSAIHKDYCLKARSTHPKALTLSGKEWSRVVIKYWFLDEAATGQDLQSIARCPLEDEKSSTLLRGVSRASSNSSKRWEISKELSPLVKRWNDISKAMPRPPRIAGALSPSEDWLARQIVDRR